MTWNSHEVLVYVIFVAIASYVMGYITGLSGWPFKKL